MKKIKRDKNETFTELKFWLYNIFLYFNYGIQYDQYLEAKFVIQRNSLTYSIFARSFGVNLKYRNSITCY